MKRSGPQRGAVLLLAAGLFVAGGREIDMSSPMAAAARPAIDLAVPARPETATFGLG